MSSRLIYRTGGHTIIPTIISLVKGLEWPKKIKIHRSLIPVKAVYFLTLSGVVSLLPFIPVYMSYVGLSAVQTGVIRGMEPFLQSVASPVWGSLADKYNKHRAMLLGGVAGTGVFYFSTSFVALLAKNRTAEWTNVTYSYNVPSTANLQTEVAHTKHNKVEYSSNSDEVLHLNLLQDSAAVNVINTSKCCLHSKKESSWVPVDEKVEQLLSSCTWQFDGTTNDYCVMCVSDELNMQCAFYLKRAQNTTEMKYGCASCSSSVGTFHHCVKSADRQALIPEAHELADNLRSSPFNNSSNVTFAILFVLIFLGRFMLAPSLPILDSTSMLLCEELTEAGDEAHYGRQRLWGGLAWGVFAPLSGTAVDIYSSHHVESFNKYLPAFCIFGAFVFVSLIPASMIRFPHHHPPDAIGKNLGMLLKKGNVLIFLFVIFITGASVGVITTYLFLFVAELSGTHTLMGLTLTITCLSEVPVMFFATRIISTLGHRGVFVLTLVCYALRFAGYSLIHNPWLVLPVELLHGVTYGLLWPACTSYGKVVAPEGMSATMQSVIFGVKCGLGEGVGALVGGVIYHVYGPRNLFRGSAALCLLTVVFYWPASIFADKRNARRHTAGTIYEKI